MNSNLRRALITDYFLDIEEEVSLAYTGKPKRGLYKRIEFVNNKDIKVIWLNDKNQELSKQWADKFEQSVKEEDDNIKSKLQIAIDMMKKVMDTSHVIYLEDAKTIFTKLEEAYYGK